ncbi:hypothetical protein SDRG_00745 [Saprolegnia diclina VS20]|uniref:DAGKc domain-containing protein n=1 Tax=Saprolegnia diclina (strain VS20) TaxID=1156394 RepID=T0QUK2_SAPDV|nr:hypothetical protein SDRG_00745 [Saprolegnia diclina VS20]EQC41889.1 hypothetical protein SDRG_00745 [Saprolegnia diclina VS20]|eukprot:XP_008604458.1 hypothetical protein SDRG_00745 [Saprolegnia diclina VS20]
MRKQRENVKGIDRMLPFAISGSLVSFNFGSGGQLGAGIESAFLNRLNPIQVDLDLPPERFALIQFRHVKNLKILVCGGDDTVAGCVLEGVRLSSA